MTADKPAPAAMSAEARRWLDLAAKNGPVAAGETTPEGMRRATFEAYRPAAEAAIKRHAVKINEIEIDGVSAMEILPPDHNSDRLILYLFGGGFMVGSPFEDLPISASLAAKTGARVIAPTYPLAPEHPFPAALDAAFKVATALTKSNPAFALAGESAGATLSLALVNRLRARALAAPLAVALMSPASDLGDMGTSVFTNAGNDPTLDPAHLPDVTEAYAPGLDMTNPEISPIYGRFDATTPPVFITSGTSDLLLSSCVKLARVLREAGAPVEFRLWEGMWHVFEFYAELPEADASLSEIATFLNAHFA